MSGKLVLVLAVCVACCLTFAWTQLGGKNGTRLRRRILRLRAELLQIPPDTDVRLKDWKDVDGLSQQIAQFETVFWEPADTESLRLLIKETPLVEGKAVLEIGCGTGVVSLCCLQADAARVVATDVNPSAIANAAFNAKNLGFEDRFDVRWVPRDRPAAYTVVGESERFDLIISNPPWENRKPKDYPEYALYDENFALMRTMLEGLEQHLTPNGKALLVYGIVDAIKMVQQLAQQYNLTVRVLDDRDLDSLAPEFLPGMLLEVTPNSSGR